jgi:predicted GNAT family acetyltransferase
MRWTADRDFEAYAARVLPTLLREPVRNNVACTLIQQRRTGMVPVEPDALWLSAHNGDGDSDGNIAGVALRTPPHILLLTDMAEEAAEALAEYLARTEPRLPGANGPVAACQRFVTRYTELVGFTASPSLASRLFELRTVQPPVGVPGALREATAADRDVLVAWSDAFAREATPEAARTTVDDPARPIDQRLVAGGLLWLWEDGGEPVSMAYLNLPANGVVRVSGVYTPPERRGRGYASACVAATSQHALDAGATACMLYTDLSNPTSNKIYQAIGYRPVTDAAAWFFEP